MLHKKVSSFAIAAFACSAGKRLCTTTTTYSLRDGKMRVYVRAENNACLTAVDVEAANSIGFLKRRVWEQTRMPPCELYLYCGDTVLEDHHILAQHEIQAEHTVYYGMSRAVVGAPSVPKTSAHHVACIQWSAVLLT